MKNFIKKSFFAVVACATVFISLSNSAVGSSLPQFFISRISATDGAEFVEIFNSGSESKISRLSIESGITSKEFFSQENLIIQPNRSILIANFAESDAQFSGNNIGQKAIIKVKISGEMVASFCAESQNNCAKAGISKNSTDIKPSGGEEVVAVNVRTLGVEKNSKGYDFELVKKSDPRAKPSFGGLAEDSGEKSGDDSADISSDKPENGGNSENGGDFSSESGEKSNGGNLENGHFDEGMNSGSDKKDETSKNENSGEKSEQNSDGDSGRNSSEEESGKSSTKNSDKKDENPQAEPTNLCLGLEFSEILLNSADGFFEIKNSSSQKINLKNCKIAYKTSKKYFEMPDFNLESGAIWAVKFADINLKPAKTTPADFYILDAQNGEISSVKMPKMGANISYAKIENEWKNSFAATFGAENILKAEPDCEEGFIFNHNSGKCQQEKSIDKIDKPCEIGYFRNPETGRCKKLEAVETKIEAPCQIGYGRNPATGRCRKVQDLTPTLTPCQAGYGRNPETNRCRKIVSGAASTNLTPCREGYYRSVETNRCRKIETEEEQKPCKDGWERNPETNRCRKIVKNEGASDAVEKSVENSKEFTGWWVIILVILGFLALVVWEFRTAIGRFFSKNK